MSESYRLNPFSFVSETPSAIIINTTPNVQVSFAKNHRCIVDFLITGNDLATSEILEQLAPARLRELVAKRVLLKGDTPPLHGRYSRQLGYFSLTTPNFNDTQKRLNEAHVLILGAGALGTHVAWNLAAIGVGAITIVDFDRIEDTNLNRQLMYTPEDIGKIKVDVLCEKISRFNPGIDVIAINRRITSSADIGSLLDEKSIVVKAIDTPEESTIWLNEACVKSGTPFVNGGFLDFTGVVGPIYIPGRSVCINCFSPPMDVRRLAGTGATFAPLTTIVTSHMSMIAYKILIGDVDPLIDKIYSFDTIRMSWREDTLRSSSDCSLCSRPANQAPSAPPSKTTVGAYRASVVILMVIAVILRVGFDQSRIGVLTFLAMLLSVPIVRMLQGGDAFRTRRELFIGASLYIAISGAGLFIQNMVNGNLVIPRTITSLLEILLQFSIGVLELSFGITVLFFLMCVTLEVVTYMQNPSEKTGELR